MGQSSKYAGIPDGDGDCYDTALHVASEMHSMLRRWPHAQATLYVCHGLATGQGRIEGMRIAHAWVEYGDLCIDRSNGGDYTLPRATYYEIGKINDADVVRYTYREALVQAVRTGHYGPWDD